MNLHLGVLEMSHIFFFVQVLRSENLLITSDLQYKSVYILLKDHTDLPSIDFKIILSNRTYIEMNDW